MTPNDPRLHIPPRLHEYKLEDLTVLDIGAGKYVSALAEQIPDLPFKHLISMDAWQKDLDAQPKCAAKKHTKICADARTAELPKADVVMMYDVLEHMTDEDYAALLDKVEALKPKKILIFGPVEVDELRPHELENPFQDHLSYMKPEYFRDRGYQVEILEKFHHYPNGTRGDAFWASR